jgi:YesN/AraC family two-component response regulator
LKKQVKRNWRWGSKQNYADFLQAFPIRKGFTATKALLKSTNMTIQQISDSLSFPNQSFFGQYFKRHAGMSPSEYRRK